MRRLICVFVKKVFSTLVEVFLANVLLEEAEDGLLHARGGVSTDFSVNNIFGVSSPRSWRCFKFGLNRLQRLLVFSTLVEVFLLRCRYCKSRKRLLHARGGVSRIGFFELINTWSSPRSWRCFFRKLAEMGKSDVFSTLVEVFRSQSSQKVSESGLLHARGGVSTAATHSSSKIESSPRSWRCFFFLLFFICFV